MMQNLLNIIWALLGGTIFIVACAYYTYYAWFNPDELRATLIRRVQWLPKWYLPREIHLSLLEDDWCWIASVWWTRVMGPLTMLLCAGLLIFGLWTALTSP